MYAYLTELIFKVDIVLLFFFVLVSFSTVSDVIIIEAKHRRRSRRLINIKKKVYDLALSYQNNKKNICIPSISEVTPQQFLDVTTNRKREATFFNESEQKILKECFVTKEKITAIQKIASRSWSKWRRIEAILTLGYAQHFDSVDILKKTAADKDSDVSYFSIIALGQIRNVFSAKVLLAFAEKHPAFRPKLFSILEVFPAEIISDEIIKLTDKLDPRIRAWAIKLMSRLKACQYSEKIERFLKDDSAEVRACACDYFGELGIKSVKNELKNAFDDDSWLVRASAIKALLKILGKESIPDIAEKIHDNSLYVIEKIKEAMVEEIDAAIPFIENFLFKGDEIAKRTSIEALESSGYVDRLFNDILSGSEKDKIAANRLLKGLIINNAHAGIEGILARFKKEDQEKILSAIRSIDANIADLIEQNIKGRT